MSGFADADDKPVPKWRTCTHLFAVCQETFAGRHAGQPESDIVSRQRCFTADWVLCSVFLLSALTASLSILRTRLKDYCSKNRRYNISEGVGGITRKGGT